MDLLQGLSYIPRQHLVAPEWVEEKVYLKMHLMNP